MTVTDPSPTTAHGARALQRSGEPGVIQPDPTPESRWSSWAAPREWPELDLDRLASSPSVVVLAAHPDDEVFAVGGLVTLLARAGARMRFVWATDGEASHPESQAPTVRDLGAVRRAESAEAVAVLGAGDAPRARLELPDGELLQREADLVRRLRCVLGPEEVVLAPWSGDRHPDHVACARAARAVAGTVLDYPLWTWFWARPDDPEVPWDRARRVPLSKDVMERKAAAMDCFASQVRPVGPDPADGPVLPPEVVAYFQRDYETVCVSPAQ